MAYMRIYAMQENLTKTCSKCGEEKPLREFYHPGARCKQCVRAIARAWTAANKEKKAETDRAYRALKGDELVIKNREWRHKNPDKVRGYTKKWEEANPEVAAESSKRKYAKYRDANRDAMNAKDKARRANDPDGAAKRQRQNAKRYEDPMYRVNATIRAGINKSVRPGAKAGRGSFDLLGYSLDDLKSHIEAQFESWMTWDNHGVDTWHIDHIRPLASFSYDTPDHPDFKIAWALSNLRPLSAKDNLTKHTKWSPPPPAANDNHSSEAF